MRRRKQAQIRADRDEKEEQGMKLRSFSKRAAYITSAVIAVLLVAGIAFAYFTSTGTGTGTATVGTSTGTISVTGTVANPLYPGTSSTVAFQASNPANFQQELSGIHLSNVSTSDPSCLPNWFTMPDVAIGAEGVLGANASNVPLATTGTLSMAETGTNQDACKNASLTLSFTTS
jgi:hypothetical protein